MSSAKNIWLDAVGLAAEVVELRNEIARLKNQTNWVCKCGGTDCEGQKENEEQARLLGKSAEREAALLAKVGRLEQKNAALQQLIEDPNAMHAHYLRHLPGWEVWSTERIRKLNSDNERLERENAELKSTIAVVFDANERGRKAWQEAHPDNQMAWPDQAQLVEWLLQRRQSNEL